MYLDHQSASTQAHTKTAAKASQPPLSPAPLPRPSPVIIIFLKQIQSLAAIFSFFLKFCELSQWNVHSNIRYHKCRYWDSLVIVEPHRLLPSTKVTLAFESVLVTSLFSCTKPVNKLLFTTYKRMLRTIIMRVAPHNWLNRILFPCRLRSLAPRTSDFLLPFGAEPLRLRVEPGDLLVSPGAEGKLFIGSSLILYAVVNKKLNGRKRTCYIWKSDMCSSYHVYCYGMYDINNIGYWDLMSDDHFAPRSRLTCEPVHFSHAVQVGAPWKHALVGTSPPNLDPLLFLYQ